MTESELVQALNAMPLGQRLAFVEDWTAGFLAWIGVGPGERQQPFFSGDIIGDVHAMQRTLHSALSEASGIGFVPRIELVDPNEDILRAIEQTHIAARQLLDIPAFQAAVGGAAITVH